MTPDYIWAMIKLNDSFLVMRYINNWNSTKNIYY